jgi:sugar lactone lactonase YvrE
MTVEAQNITTVAGGGPPSGPTPLVSKTVVGVGAAAAVKQDNLGNTYVMDNNLGRIFKVDTLGNVTLFAGNGVPGFSGEGGLAVNASLFEPSGMCVDPTSNNVYVADSDNGIIREIPVATAGGKIANHIYTVAGVQAQAGFDFAGDGAAATSAHLHFPDGCAFDSHGNMYIADRGNNEIRVVIGPLGVLPVGVTPPITPGFIYRFAGGNNGAPPNPPTGGYGTDGTPAITAPIYGPFDVFVDSHNNVFFADLGNNFPPAGPNKDPAPFNNNVIREILASDGTIHTVAGTPGVAGVGHTTGVPATTAFLNQPIGISVDAAGDLFFADQVNQVIREVPAVTAGGMTAGNIYDVAGVAGVRGYLAEPSAATANNLNFPAGTFVNAAGSLLLIADSNNDRIRQVVTGTINTFAGNGSNSFSNGTPATAGQLNVVAGVAVSALGGLAIADVGPSNDHQSLIRGVAAPILSGALTTVAGQLGFSGFSNTAPFVVNNALGVAYDSAGNLYIADTANCVVRKITGAAIATVAGKEPTTADPVNHPEITVPQCGFNVQGGAAVGTELGAVNSVAIDASGNVFFSDATNNVIWEVPATTVGTMNAGSAYIVVGMQSTTGAFGGEGIAANQARLHTPTGISFDIYGNLFIADTGNNLIREVPAVNVTTPVPMTAGSIYTVAGASDQSAGFTPDGQPANGAKLNAPFTAVADNAGDIFIADTNNQVVREVAATTAGGRTVGDLYTVAGTHGSAGLSGDGAAATSAQLNFPKGLAIDAHDAVSGNAPLLIGDSLNNRVRSVSALADVAAVAFATPSPTTLTFTAQQVGVASAAQPITLSNPGGATLHVSAIHFAGTSALDYSETDNCVTPGTVAAGASCTINVVFTPHALGDSTAALTISDSAFGTPQTVALKGTGGSPAAVPSPTSLTFPSQIINTTSTALPVIITNSGNVATLFTGITVGGANGVDFAQTNDCPVSPSGLAVNGTCTITVTFKPTATGARVGEIDIADNVTGGMQTIALSGTATPAALTLNLGAGASGSTSATVTAGQTATYNLQITANQNASVTFTCTGAPTAATCTVPAAAVAVTAGTPAPVSVTVSTTARGLLVPQSQPATRMQPPAAIQMLRISVLAMLLLIATLLAMTQSPAGRLRVARAALSACLVLMPLAAATLLVGCGGGGGGGSSTPPPATGTPAGTYTVVVTATSGSQSAKTNLTLIVQ